MRGGRGELRRYTPQARADVQALALPTVTRIGQVSQTPGKCIQEGHNDQSLPDEPLFWVLTDSLNSSQAKEDMRYR